MRSKTFKIAHYGRDNSGGTHGRRGNDLTAGGVFFRDGEAPEVYPVYHQQRIVVVVAKLLLQTAVNFVGATFNVQTSGKRTFGFHAAIDGGLHNPVDFPNSFHYFIVRTERRFVNQNHVGNRKPLLFADFEKFGGRAVVKGNLIRLALDAAADFVLPGNGAAADRK